MEKMQQSRNCLILLLYYAILEISCQPEEIYKSDGCKCGTADSCLGNRRGEICDSKNSRCMCSKGIEACKEGEYCLNRVCSGNDVDFV